MITPSNKYYQALKHYYDKFDAYLNDEDMTDEEETTMANELNEEEDELVNLLHDFVLGTIEKSKIKVLLSTNRDKLLDIFARYSGNKK